ncbi:MAG: hypothetical protein FJY55_12450 [Betaproteobacteria bacterium]|nr:hypothetical protein [Betaproteobacteria bacterium]
MPAGKTSTLTFRIAPALKEALRTAGEREHRSIANMVEVMIRDYCGRNGIKIPEEKALSYLHNRAAKPAKKYAR